MASLPVHLGADCRVGGSIETAQTGGIIFADSNELTKASDVLVIDEDRLNFAQRASCPGPGR